MLKIVNKGFKVALIITLNDIMGYVLEMIKKTEILSRETKNFTTN